MLEWIYDVRPEELPQDYVPGTHHSPRPLETCRGEGASFTKKFRGDFVRQTSADSRRGRVGCEVKGPQVREARCQDLT